jgi:hypothetical protein
MSETLLGTIPLVGTIITAIASWFYQWGGRSRKWRRRFVGSLISSTAIWVETLLLGIFNFWHLLAYPLIILRNHLGYGSEILSKKILKRSLVVVTSLLVGLLMCLTIGGKAWLILPLQLLIASGSIWLGVKNPIFAAPEEFFVNLLLDLCNLLYPFVGSL